MSELINMTTATATAMKIAYEEEVVRQVNNLDVCLSNEGDQYEQDIRDSLIDNLTVFYKETTGLCSNTRPPAGNILIQLLGDEVLDYYTPQQFNITITDEEGAEICNRDLICSSMKRLDDIIHYRATEDEELFSYNPIYINGFIKEDYRTINNTDIEYVEPDLECEEDIPLYDCDECPVCMEKFGLNETQHIINKKIIKTTKTVCVKRNTYCGHPLCMDCFNTICDDKKSCPICRKDYEETGDIAIAEYEEKLDDDAIQTMIEMCDHRLYDIVDMDALIEQQLTVDGYDGLLHLQGWVNQESNILFAIEYDYL